jgi:chromosome segregation ATPase
MIVLPNPHWPLLGRNDNIVQESLMTTTEIQIEKLQAQLDEWKAEVEKLEAKAASANADAKESYEKEVAQLKEKYAEAEKEFKEMRKSQQSASSDIMEGMGAAWRELGNAVNKAVSRFN